MKNTLTKCNAVLLAIAVSALPVLFVSHGLAAQNRASANGGGIALVTIPDGAVLPVHFGLCGIVRADGSTVGQMNFVFPPPFGDMFGVGLIHIQGRVTSGTVPQTAPSSWKAP
jgi:hypothetical protein